MENQNRFDLERALEDWRNDCLNQPGISLEDAKELEGDLRERIADLLEHGTSEREAFANAVRQVGPVRALAREFAKENPLPIWRERVFWMLLAGFALSVWGLFTDGLLDWLINTYRAILPWSMTSCRVLSGYLPILAAAALLAAGRLVSLADFAEWLTRSRRRLAVVGVMFILVGLGVRMFGPPTYSFSSLSRNWFIYWTAEPSILLALCVLFFQKHYSKVTGGLGGKTATVPVAVWRERVFWIALGGIVVGFWNCVSLFSVRALFSGGDANFPYNVNVLVLLSVYQTIHLGPLLAIGWLVILWKRKGTPIITRVWPDHIPVTALVASLVCAWVGLTIWLNFLWVPHDQHVGAKAVLLNYLTTLQWGWPLGLAALGLWLAPRPRADELRLEPAAE